MLIQLKNYVFSLETRRTEIQRSLKKICMKPFKSKKKQPHKHPSEMIKSAHCLKNKIPHINKCLYYMNKAKTYKFLSNVY